MRLTEMKIFLFICVHFWNFLSHDVIKVHIVCVLETQDSKEFSQVSVVHMWFVPEMLLL